MVIQWMNKKEKLQTFTLQPLMDKEQRVVSQFSLIYYDHIYTHQNEEAKRLSKNGLDVGLGTCKVVEDQEGNKT